MNADVEAVRSSFGRCCVKGDVIGRFYEFFLKSHPDIGPRFAHTDFETQKNLLRQGINLAILFAAGVPTGAMAIGRLRETHKQSRLNISPTLYPFWQKSLLQAIAEFDAQFSPTLRRQWEGVLRKTIDHITAGYDDSAAIKRAAMAKK